MMRMAAGEAGEGGERRGREGGGMKMESRVDGGGGGVRGGGPQGRMSSCLANERLAVEAPSSLLTPSFVLHHQPSRSPPLSSLEHIISQIRNRKQYCGCLLEAIFKTNIHKIK